MLVEKRGRKEEKRRNWAKGKGRRGRLRLFKVGRRERIDKEGNLRGSLTYFSPNGDIIVVRYEAGANGYRVLPITKKEFAEVMQAANRPKTTFASKHPQPRPQPIFPKSKEESRSPKLRTEESLHPKSAIPAPNVETSSSKKYEKTLENSGREENPSPIIPAFLRPKVS